MIKFYNWLVTTEAFLSVRLGLSQQESADGMGYAYEKIENNHAYGATRQWLPPASPPLIDDVVVGSDDKTTGRPSFGVIQAFTAPATWRTSYRNSHTDDESTDPAYCIDQDNYKNPEAYGLSEMTKLRPIGYKRYLALPSTIG